MDIDGNPIGTGSDQPLNSGDDVSFKSTLVQELKLVNDGTPTTPDSGIVSIYSKTNSKIYYLDDTGKERELGGGSSAGGGSLWLFTTSTAGDPGVFNLGFNNATPASVTQISISKTDFNNESQNILLGSMTGGDQLFLSNDDTRAKLYTLSSAGVDSGTYFTFTVSFESQDLVTNFAPNAGITVDALLQNPFNQLLNTSDTPTFAGLNLNGDLTTGNIRPAGLSGVSDIGLGGGPKYRNLFLSENVQCDTVDCNVVSCDGNVLTGDIIPKVTENRDIGQATQQYRNAYFSGTIFDNNVALPKIYTEDNGNATNSTAVGKTAGNVGVVTGSSNSSLGERALEKVTTGGQNTAVGNLSMYNLNTGSANTSIGWNTMPFGSSGRFNTCIGGSAGQNLTTGENNTCIGYNTKTGTGNAQNRIMIGRDATGTTDNECVIGNNILSTIRAGATNVCDLGTTGTRYKNAYLSGTLDAMAITLPAGDVQTQINDANSGSTDGLALKMDKVATTDLNMSSFNITGAGIVNTGGLISSGLVTTGLLRPTSSFGGTDIGDKTPITGSIYRDLYLSGKVECSTIDCPGPIVTGNLIPTATNLSDLGTIGTRYKNAYLSGTLDVAAVQLPGGDVQTQINDANSSTTSGLALKMDKIATTDLDMAFFDINRVDAVSANRVTNTSYNVFVDLTTTDVSITTGGSQSILVNPTGLTVNNDAYINGIVKTDTITALAGGLVDNSFTDDFTSGSLHGGVVLQNASFQPGYVELAPNLVSQYGQIQYSTAGRPTGATFSMSCDWSFVDADSQDAAAFYVFLTDTDLSTQTNVAEGSAILGLHASYNTNNNNLYLYNNGATIGTIGLTLVRNTTYNFRMEVDNGTTVRLYHDNNLQFTRTTTVGNRSYFGMGARTSPVFICSYRADSFTYSPELVPVTSSVTVDSDMVVTGSINGITPVGGLFAQTVDTTFIAPTTPATQQMIGTGVGTLTVPANGFKIGDSFHLKCGGLKSNGNGSDIQIMLKSGTVILAESGVISLVGLTDAPWEMELDFTIRTLGGPGTANINSNGQWTVTDAGVYLGFGFNNVNNTTFNTNIENTLTMDIMQSDATNFVSVTNLVLSKVF
jgi:hypothetical protein